MREGCNAFIWPVSEYERAHLLDIIEGEQKTGIIKCKAFMKHFIELGLKEKERKRIEQLNILKQQEEEKLQQKVIHEKVLKG
jgi:hypothetical protein